MVTIEYVQFCLLFTQPDNHAIFGEAEGLHIFELDIFLVLEDALLPFAVEVDLADIFLAADNEEFMVLV
jgi:hypothetical protein